MLLCFGLVFYHFFGGSKVITLSATSVRGYSSSSSSSSFGDFDPSSTPRILVMAASNCGEFVPKRWISHPHEHGVIYDFVLYDYSVEGDCKKHIVEGPHTIYVHRPRSYKWPAVYDLFRHQPWGALALARHDFFFLSDDDVDIPGDALGIRRLAAYCKAAGLYICQPSLSDKSAVNMDITAHTPGEHHVRVTGFVEQMSPLFTREALTQFLPHFETLTHGWGIDALWSDAKEGESESERRPIGVVDAVQIDHMRKSGVSNLYKRVGGIEKAEKERAAFKAEKGISDDVFLLMEAGHAGEGQRILIDRSLPDEGEEERTGGGGVEGGRL
jgi:hypothetical protein